MIQRRISTASKARRLVMESALNLFSKRKRNTPTLASSESGLTPNTCSKGLSSIFFFEVFFSSRGIVINSGDFFACSCFFVGADILWSKKINFAYFNNNFAYTLETPLLREFCNFAYQYSNFSYYGIVCMNTMVYG